MEKRGSVLLILALLVGPACKQQAPEPPPAAPPPVQVHTVAETSLVPTASATGEIQAVRSASLRAEAPGRVVAIDFDRGDTVEAGQVLLRLDVGRTTVALGAAGAGVDQAEARLAQATREREMAERLVQSGGVAQRALDDARDGERLARAAVEAARAQVQVTRRGLTEAVVRAPFSGSIAERFVEVGEFLGPGAPVALLVDASGLKARVLLDPREAMDIPIGAHATVTAHARPGESFEAHVTQVGEVVDPRSRRLPVELVVDDPDGRLRPGLVGRFTVETGPARQALLVDADAVFERFGSYHVYVVEDGTAHRRAVQLGLTREGQAEVVRGLSRGDQVIVRGVERVVDAQPVHVVEGIAAGEQGDSEAGP